MVVQFDKKALQETVNHKVEPIGVEGDPSSSKKGGISEADAILKEASKGIRKTDGSGDLDDNMKPLSEELIREEKEKEPGPELTLPKVK